MAANSNIGNLLGNLGISSKIEEEESEGDGNASARRRENENELMAINEDYKREEIESENIAKMLKEGVKSKPGN
jgi:hypothetical protein